MFSRAGTPVRQKIGVKAFKAPVRGLVLNENLAGMRALGAVVMENWKPLARGAKVRAGHTLDATVGTKPVESMMSYDAGGTRKRFAVCDGSIFNVTSVADPKVAPTADVTGLTANYFAYANFVTTGGAYMVCVNGADDLRLYTGSTWYKQNDQALKALQFDAQSGNFTVGLTVTGGSSGATGVIESQSDAGTTGTLYVRGISGTFQDNEAITDTSTGAATVNGTATTVVPAITGADTADFSFVWLYRNRLFFVKAGSQTAYCLPVDSIGGALITINLGGVFKHGGSLMFGGTWSQDAGDGLDDKCVFVSDRGERVVYQGNDPSSADPADWDFVGRYDGAPPMGIRCTLTAGGDFVIGDKKGLVPISAAIVKDAAAIETSALTLSIEPLWNEAALARDSMPWEAVKWSEGQIAIVSTPVTADEQDAQCFVINLQTGAAAVYTGWNTRCLLLHDGALFFGTNDGKVMQAEVGGSDNGSPYVARLGMAWDHCGQEGVYKEFQSIRGVFRAGRPFNAQLSVSTDYTTDWQAAPSAADGVDSSLWDEGAWDSAVWDGTAAALAVNQAWDAIQLGGSVVSPQVQITSGSGSSPDVELVSLHLEWTEGAFLT